ncbi:hypothetical protein [Cohnella faecalis]
MSVIVKGATFEEVYAELQRLTRVPPTSKEPLVRPVSSETSWQTVLRDLILNAKTGADKFAVVNLEAGVGKSSETERIIIDHIEHMRTRNRLRFLIVKQFNEDVYKCAETIKSFKRPRTKSCCMMWL